MILLNSTDIHGQNVNILDKYNFEYMENITSIGKVNIYRRFLKKYLLMKYLEFF